ncbi:MAG: class I tRNA ligase family protein, partial [Butyrivibrio sp.]|nr:class I tRNA ligase family protein [Butyrivibrio sp.]
MAEAYNHSFIEKKWREAWAKNPINTPAPGKKKYYCLDMFPYPSAAGLHVGHWRGYVISDVWSRYQMMHGNHYLIHPMGWDAFGLPAENYAIKTGQHPSVSTAANVASIREQVKQIGAIYDWDMELNTTDPEFYRWTQWIFVQMFKKGLAYEKEMPLNWCPSCKAVLANEEVVDGKCERCHSEVTKKNLRQWMLKITAYADRLLEGLEGLDWPEKVKKMQTEWIGRSYGAEVNFPVAAEDGSATDQVITVYTTRPDTLYGATFMVLSPEHALVQRAVRRGILEVNVMDMKECADGSFRHIDDAVYGPGSGMVIRYPVALAALEKAGAGRKVLLSAAGAPYTQKTAHRFAGLDHLILLCGHYEGFDARIEAEVDEEISIGDYILSGGEPAAYVIIDSIARLLGTIREESMEEESFENGLLEYPQYTSPRSFNGRDVPGVL